MAKYWRSVWLGAVLSSEMRHNICERVTNCPIGVLKCVRNRLCFNSFPPNLRIVLWKTCFPVFVLQICVAAIVWELWSKHFTSEHVAFSRCLFVSHPVCKGLQNLKKKDRGPPLLRVYLHPKTFLLRSTIIPRRDESHECISSWPPAVFCLSAFALLQLLPRFNRLTHHSPRLARYLSPKPEMA